MLRSWDEVFDAAGGPAEVGRAIGVSTEHATAMRRRGRIPSRYWMDLVRDCEARGIESVTYEVLATIDADITHHNPSRAEVA